jgi:hypothetical protein
MIHVVSQRRAGAGLLLQVLRAHPAVAADETRISVSVDEIPPMDFGERALSLHRHCLDVVASHLRRTKATALVLAQGREVHDASVGQLIEKWCDSTEAQLEFEAANRKRALRLRYEDLVADRGKAALRRALSFLALPWIDDLTERLSSEWTRPLFWYLPLSIRARVKWEVERRASRGNGRSNALYSVAILPDRVGRGRELDLTDASPPMLKRMNDLLKFAGYSPCQSN